jgi:excisionase family DNA binding protein
MAMTETKIVRRSGAFRPVRGALSPSPAQQPDANAAADANAASRNADAPGERLAYSVAEAAFITGLSRDLLYDQMRAGKLAYLKVGRRRVITRQNLEAFLARSAS